MKKLFLIEDNVEMRENTTEILELAGYKVFSATNGKGGVAIALKEKPDLIICDIMMPVLDGYGVLHLLSKNSETASIPFVFLTAKAERNDFRKGMEMGADDYITKPFDDIELLNAVESRLKKSDLMRKEFSKNQEGLNQFINEAKNFNDLKKLSDDREIRKLKRKDFIFSEGQFPRGVFFINKGKVKTFKINEDAKEFITGLYKEGDFIGYLSLLEDGKYSDTAEVLDDCEVSFIPKEDFFELLYKNAEVSKKFIRMLSDNLHEREEQLIKLAYNSVRKRVAEALTTLQNRFKKDDDKNFSMNVAREDLASIAGTSVETAIRTLSNFKDENLVEIKGGTITIINQAKLEAMRN